MFIRKPGYGSLFKAMALLLTCLFIVNDIGWAQLSGSHLSKSTTLAPTTQLTRVDFKEKFKIRAYLLAHDAVNKYIKDQVEREIKVLGQKDWQRRKTALLDVNSKRERGSTKNIVVNMGGPVKLISVTGLLRNTGQCAHVGLSAKDYKNISSVIYIDSQFFDRSLAQDSSLSRHEVDEIIQWEDLRINILKLEKTRMRQWIKDHIDSSDERLNSTRYESLTSRQIAKLFHVNSYSIDSLYERFVTTYDFNYEYMDTMLSLYGIDEGNSDVNIAAGGISKIGQNKEWKRLRRTYGYLVRAIDDDRFLEGLLSMERWVRKGFFASFLYTLNKNFSPDELRTHWNEIAKLTTTPGIDALYLFQNGIPHLIKYLDEDEITSRAKFDRMWPVIALLGQLFNRSANELFTNIPQFRKMADLLNDTRISSAREYFIEIASIENVPPAVDSLAGFFRDFINKLSRQYGDTFVKVLPRYVELIKQREEGLDALPNLVLSPLSVEDLKREIEKVRNGQFDENNPLHMDINYLLIRNELKRSPVYERFYKYEDFIEFFNKAKRPSPTAEERGIDNNELAELRGVVYEAHRVREKILEIAVQAKKLGRPLVVIQNLSYGAVALAPITEERKGFTCIVGTDIPVWSTKIGSTESHGNEYVMNEDLFTESQIRYLLEYQPFIVLVDGSTSVDDPIRTAAHIPDGYKGYRNEAILLSDVLSGRSRLSGKLFQCSNEHMSELFGTSVYNRKLSRYKALLPEARQIAPPYSFHFWYPGTTLLYTRLGKHKDTIPPKVDISSLNGPCVIFIESAMEDTAIPKEIKDKFIRGEHHAAFFDDKNRFEKFFLTYDKSYGIKLSRTYILAARSLYEQYRAAFGLPAITTKKPAEAREFLRPIRVVFSDLDGVLAKQGEMLNQEIVHRILGLFRRNISLVLLTDEIESLLDKRLKPLLENPDIRPYLPLLYIFSAGGSFAYTYDAAGTKKYFTNYNRKSLFSDTERAHIMSTIERLSIGRCSVDTREDKIFPRTRIDLVNVQKRDEFVRLLKERLEEENIGNQIYKVGRTSVKVVKFDKAAAAGVWLSAHPDFKVSEALILEDTARRYNNGRRLLTVFPEAVSVNLGEPATTIYRENPHVLQIGRRNVSGAIELLDQVMQESGVLISRIQAQESLRTPFSEYTEVSHAGEDLMRETKGMNIAAGNDARIDDIKRNPSGLENIDSFLGIPHYNALWHREGGIRATLRNHLQEMLTSLNRVDDSSLSGAVYPDLIDLVKYQIRENRDEMEVAILTHDLGKKETASKNAQGNWIFHGHEEKSYELLRGSHINYKGKPISAKVLLTAKYHDMHWRINYDRPNEFNGLMRKMREDFEGSDEELKQAVEFMIAFSAIDVLGSILDGGRRGDLKSVVQFAEHFKKWWTEKLAAVTKYATEAEQLTAQNKPDIASTLQILNELIPKIEKQDDLKYYTIKYNVTKIPQGSPTESLLKTYVEKVLPMYMSGKNRVKLTPSGAHNQSLISVECYKDQSRSQTIGESHVDVDGDIRGKALRLIGMLNMAFVASQIPKDISADEMSKYDNAISFIKQQYKEISGEELAEDILKDTANGVWIKLPHAAPVPLDKVDEYYRLTITQLEQAA